MTVQDLIHALQQFPMDLPVSTVDSFVGDDGDDNVPLPVLRVIHGTFEDEAYCLIVTDVG